MGWFIALISGDFLQMHMERVRSECQALGPWEGAGMGQRQLTGQCGPTGQMGAGQALSPVASPGRLWKKGQRLTS